MTWFLLTADDQGYNLGEPLNGIFIRGAYRGGSFNLTQEIVMMNQRIAVALAALALAGFAGASIASDERCTDAPKSAWLSQEAIAARLKEQGFEVTRTETRRACYEVKARNTQGQRVELKVDPATGRVVRQESEHRS